MASAAPVLKASLRRAEATAVVGERRSLATACLVCGSGECHTHPIRHRFYRHQDWEPAEIQPPGLAECHACGAIFMPDAEICSSLSGMYAGENYATNRKANHVIIQGEAVQGIHARMADYIRERLQIDRPRTLDVGCFDGRLLVELEKRYEAFTGHGFDVSAHIRDLFPTSRRLQYFHGSLEALSGLYDLITIVNVLPYIEHPAQLMAEVERLLAPGGALFVTSSNFATNPWALLLGDQTAYFAPDNLAGYLEAYGFQVDEFVGIDDFPRNVMAFARRRGDGSACASPRLPVLPHLVGQLDDAAADLVSAAIEFRRVSPQARLAVLGGTVNAAWTVDTLEGRVDLLVDENPNRIGRTLRGVPIRHPRELDERDLMVLPYGATAEPLRQRLASRFPMRMLTI